MNPPSAHSIPLSLIASLLGIFVWAGCLAAPAPIVQPDGLEERFQPLVNLHWGEFRNASGARIRYCWTDPPTAAKGTVVLVTGFSEHAEKYFELMRDFARLGYGVWEMDWRGLGGSDHYLEDSEKGHSSGFENDVRDLDQFLREVVKAQPGRPLVLVSHSMGGNVGLRYLQEHPGIFDAAVLSSPALSIGPGSGWKRPLARAYVWAMAHLGFGAAYFVGGHPWREAEDVPTGLSHDPVRGAVQKRWFAANPRLRIGGPTNRWYDELVRSYELVTTPSRLQTIRVPVLVGVALDDPVVNPGPVLEAAAALPKGRAVRVERAWHELFMETDAIRSPWLHEIETFLQGI